MEPHKTDPKDAVPSDFVEVRLQDIERLRADSRRLEALLDPEGAVCAVIIGAEEFQDSEAIVYGPRIHTRDEIDEVLDAD